MGTASGPVRSGEENICIISSQYHVPKTKLICSSRNTTSDPVKLDYLVVVQCYLSSLHRSDLSVKWGFNGDLHPASFRSLFTIMAGVRRGIFRSLYLPQSRSQETNWEVLPTTKYVHSSYTFVDWGNDR